MVGSPAGVCETHISWVFFVGDRAFKLKKPVRTAFLDFTTVDARRVDCEREVTLNRRLAPDVYEGVVTVIGPDGTVCDHLVAMKRMPDDRRLARLLTEHGDEPALRRELLAIARRLAAFHAGAERSSDIDRAGSKETTASRWSANTAQLQPFAPELLDADRVDEVDALATRYVAGRGPLFDERIAAGRIVDGHGDLLADDIFCLDDGPRILDCLEFDDRLRWGDGLADAAFLAMDVERLGRPDLASVFLAAYEAAGADSWPPSLADHHVAYRAHVRCKVACLRAAQGAATASQAGQLLRIAHDHLQRAAVRIVLLGGLPGTGKSTLAAALGRRLGWPVLRSDVIRKELAGDAVAAVAVAAPAGSACYRSSLYDAAWTARTYAEMSARAAGLASHGRSVILDASWTAEANRDLARHAAAKAYADVIELRCVAPAAIADDRIARRRRAGGDASDATPAIASAMVADADPWPRAATIDTAGAIDEAVADALAIVAPGLPR